MAKLPQKSIPDMKLTGDTQRFLSFQVCFLVCTIIWSKLPHYTPWCWCVLVVQIDPGACSRTSSETQGQLVGAGRSKWRLKLMMSSRYSKWMVAKTTEEPALSVSRIYFIRISRLKFAIYFVPPQLTAPGSHAEDGFGSKPLRLYRPSAMKKSSILLQGPP